MSSAAESTANSMAQQMTPDEAKVKCRNFLATLLRKTSDQPESVVRNVRALIQGLIDGMVGPELFTMKLVKELNSSPQPCLVPFLKKSLSYLQHSLANRELTIEGILPPTINQVEMLPDDVCDLLQLEMAPPFNWPMKLKQIVDDTHQSHIPPDVTFKILKDGVPHKIDAHKMVLGMVSPVFHRMLFVLWREDKEVLVEGMTPAAFKIMKNAIYNVMSMEKSLKGKSATDVFAVLDLVKRYQIHELKKIVLDHLSFFPLAEDTVLEVAADAMKRSQSEFGGQGLFLRCAKFLRPKFTDAQAVFQYLADHKDQKEVINELLVVMKDLDPPSNSEKGMEQQLSTRGTNMAQSGLILAPKQQQLSTRGINMVQASTLRTERSTKWSAGSGKVKKGQYNSWMDDIEKRGEDWDNWDTKMKSTYSNNKVPAKKVGLVLNKVSRKRSRVESDDDDDNLSPFKVQGVDKQCVTPVKFRGKTVKEIEAMGDQDKLEYTLYMSMKSVAVTNTPAARK